MKNIIAFAGSNSKNSINKTLAVYASSLVTEVNVNVLDLNDYELPLYGVDYQSEHGIPNTAKEFLEKLKNTDGIILSLAEHNGVYTTAFKNLFDWVSVIDSKLWSNKPMLLMATSPGERGGTTILEIAKGRFPFMGANIVADFSLPSFDENFLDGKIVNQELNNTLLTQVKKFNDAL